MACDLMPFMLAGFKLATTTQSLFCISASGMNLTSPLMTCRQAHNSLSSLEPQAKPSEALGPEAQIAVTEHALARLFEPGAVLGWQAAANTSIKAQTPLTERPAAAKDHATQA